MSTPLSLAQTAPDSTGLFVLVGVVLALIVVASVVIVVVRRRLTSDEQAQSFSSGSLMDQLRTMHDEGKLSDEEFATAKAKLGGRLKAEVMRPKARGAAAGKDLPPRAMPKVMTKPASAPGTEVPPAAPRAAPTVAPPDPILGPISRPARSGPTLQNGSLRPKLNPGNPPNQFKPPTPPPHQ